MPMASGVEAIPPEPRLFFLSIERGGRGKWEESPEGLWASASEASQPVGKEWEGWTQGSSITRSSQRRTIGIMKYMVG
jgi:hypothetical protein